MSETLDQATDRIVDVFRNAGRKVKQNGVGCEVSCPGPGHANGDRHPSLSIRPGIKAVVIHCHAHCDTKMVLAAVGLTEADLFPRNDGGSGWGSVVATYPYVDEEGRNLFRVHRTALKKFWQERYDNGTWRKDLGDTRRVLYHLDEVSRERGHVWVVEGEKDADRLRSAGEVATTNPMGAGSWRGEYAGLLGHVSKVTVVADRDDAGRSHARAIATSLRAARINVEVVQPPEGHKDISDMLAAGLTPKDLEPLGDDEVAQATSGIFLDWSEFWGKDRNDPEWLHENVLARGRGHAAYAPAGTKKSLFTLWVAAQLTTSHEPVAGIYLDYEMTEDDLYERLADMGYGPDTDLSRFHYALLPNLPPLDTKEGGEAIDQILDQVQAAHPDHHLFVVIDTTGRAVEGEENSADTLRKFYSHTGIILKRRGVTWIRLDHTGKDISKGQRGTKAKDDDPDVVWLLRETEHGIMLVAKKRRMGWVPDRAIFTQLDTPLRFQPVAGDWPKGTQETVDLLDRLAVPVDASTRAAQAALKEAEEGRRREVVIAAQKWRVEARNHPGNHLVIPTREPPPEPPNEKPTITRPEPLPEPPGTTTPAGRKPGSPLIGEPVPMPTTECSECGMAEGRHGFACSRYDDETDRIAGR